MPVAARFRLRSSVSAWAGAFARIAALVIIFAGYLLLLFFVSSKPFYSYFINQCSKHVVRGMGLVCLLAVLLLQCQSSLCLHPENVLSLWCFYRESLWPQRSLLVMPYASRIYSIFPLWIESKALVKSTNSIVACRFFARTPSRILRIDPRPHKYWLFLRKPFWFFLRMLSILGSRRLRSRALYFLAAMDVSVIPQ